MSLSRSTRLLPFGAYDPTGFADSRGTAKAYETQAGPATVHLARITPEEVRARAWGPGANVALSGADGLVGVFDDPAGFVSITTDLARRFAAQAGLRIVSVPWVFDALLRIILQQRVRFVEAARAYRAVVKRHGAKAPGPFDLVVAPSAKTWLTVPAHELSSLSVDKKRIDTLKHAARLARHIEKLTGTRDFGEARRVLKQLPGIGPWTMESFLGQALGDADAVPTGDVHLPRIVCTALEPKSTARYDDARMLALLAPWTGHRGRVVRLLMSEDGERVVL